MILDTDQDIQQRFDNLLDGVLNEETLLAFGCKKVVKDDGFVSSTVFKDNTYCRTTEWIVEYRGISKILKIKAYESMIGEHSSWIEATISGRKYYDESKTSWYSSSEHVCSMRDIFDFIDKELELYKAHPELDEENEVYKQMTRVMDKSLSILYSYDLEQDFVRMYENI